MRKLAIALVVIAIIAIMSYTALWYKQADDFKAFTEQSIATLNQKAKTMGLPNGFIRYERLETSGFPSSMTLTMTKPVFDVPVTAVLRALPAATMHPATASAPQNWVVESSYADSIAISGSVRGNRYTFTSNGDRMEKSLVDSKLIQTIVTTGAPHACTLEVEQPIGGALWTMRPIFSDAKTFLEVFRSIECDASGIVATDAATHAKLASYDSFHFKAANIPSGAANHAIMLAMDMKNAVFSPAFDQTLYRYMQMANGLMGIPQDQQMAPMRFSEYGTQNTALDIRYDGPVDAAHISDPDMQMRFDINRFDVKTAILNQSLQMHAKSEPHGNDRTASITFEGKGAVSERYDAILAERVTASLAQAMNPEGKFGPALQIAMTLKRLGLTPQEITAAVLPHSHSFGDMGLKIDAGIKGPNHGADMFKHGNLTVDALDWITTPYGITLKGHADFSAPDGKPAGEFVETCIRCDALITDAGAYAMRLEGLASHMQPPHVPYVTAALLEGVRKFLHGIAENAGAQDLVTEFKFAPGVFTISGKGLPEILGLYMTTIAPVQPHPQPSGAPPASQLAPPALGR